MNTGFHFFEEDAPLFVFEAQELPLIAALALAAIALELFLAFKKDGRLGLVLPGLWLLRSVVRLIVRAVQLVLMGSSLSLPPMGGALLIALLVENILTLMLLAVYGLCRLCKRWKTVQQLKKSRIQDL